MGKWCLHLFSAAFGPILFVLACNEDMHKSLDKFKFRQVRTTDYGVSCPWASKNSHRLIMGKCCLHASLIIFDQIIIKVAGNQDRHKSSIEFDFGPNQTIHFWVTCPWVTKISHFWTWISLTPVGQSWSNFICSIIRVGERLLKVLGQIYFGTLDSGERSLPFGLLVMLAIGTNKQVAQRATIANLSPMCQGQISFQKHINGPWKPEARNRTRPSFYACPGYQQLWWWFDQKWRS